MSRIYERHTRTTAGRMTPVIVALSATLLCACAAGSAQASSSSAATTARPTATSTTVVSNAASATTVDPNPVGVYDVDAPTVTPAGSQVPGPTVVGVQSPNTSNALVDAVYTTWQTLAWTLYSHHDRENAKTGYYQFDCVGATNYFLSVADPNANNALLSAEKIKAHYVPTPLRVADYLASLPAGGTSLWNPVTRASRIGPGDIIAVPPAPGSSEPGHAMMTAGPAVPLTNGDYAVLVFDSTAAPGHGPFDSRRWDTRDQPLPNVPNKPPDRKSGLGYGTVEVTVTSNGAPRNILWSVGGSEYGGQIEIAQPLS
jgi:hypothetical protein